jgi:hypothetical protein
MIDVPRERVSIEFNESCFEELRAAERAAGMIREALQRVSQGKPSRDNRMLPCNSHQRGHGIRRSRIECLLPAVQTSSNKTASKNQ